ncbi:hypothetical protein PHISP_02485 [Aspergillus sp. HF37]|nr:hypothetical protein PHISP_02485 [Aspergillus sp. HF37]
MVIPKGPGALSSYRGLQTSPIILRRSFATRGHDPLRILFCGSDEFSIASLKALREEHLSRPDRISSIDVVCRPGKRVGRGLKQIREVPIKAAASNLSLPVHEIDTFTGWTPPIPGGFINLVIAVSFGLFVPPRILNYAKYGGLNVHPSLLPNFRGPAPLHHTLLAGHTRTGVTLQTLHPTHFDNGVILDQTPAPGFEIPNPDSCTVPQLLEVVAPMGGRMLLDGIKSGLFVPPVKDAGWRASEGQETLIHAAKIKPEDRHIDWANWPWAEINRRNRILGPLWSKALVSNRSVDGSLSFQQRRVVFTEIEEVDPLEGCDAFALIPGVPFVDDTSPIEPQQGKGLYVFTRDGKLIRIRQMKVEGMQSADGVRAALKGKMLSDQTFGSNAARYTTFYNPFQ